MNVSSESQAAGWIVPAAFLVAVAMIAQQLAGKAIRDAFFLTVFEPAVLPNVMTIASILSVVAVFGVTALYGRFAPAQLVPLFFFASGALFAAEWFVSAWMPKLAAVSVYLHTTSFGAVAISGFWSLMSERFDPYTAKRVIGRIAGGATLGGVVGGIAAWQGAGRVSLATMLLVLCAVNVFCGVMLLRIGRGGSREAQKRKGSDRPLAVFEETPYLVQLAILVGLLAFGTAGFDYVFKSAAASAYADKDQLVSFFALFYLGVGVLTFVMQSTLTQRLLPRLGLGGAIATLPMTIFTFAGLSLLFPGLALLVVLRGGAATVESSLFRSGYELLYTPLPPRKKRSAKTFIDVGADKLGATLGAALAVFLVGLIPATASAALLLVSLGCAVGAVWVSRRLARGYVEALEDSLAAGQGNSAEMGGADLATISAVGVAHTSSVAVRPHHHRSPGMQDLPSAVEPSIPTDDPDGHIRAIGAFRSRDPAGIEWVLRQRSDIPRLWIPGLIRLLDDGPVADRVATALMKVAPAHVGLMTDALLSRRYSLGVRRRLTEMLASVGTERSAQGLVAALRAEPFEIRYRAAVALSDVQRGTDVRIDENTIFAAAEREVDRANTNFFGDGTDAAGGLSPAGTEAARSMAFCIRVLSAILPHEPLFNALDALGENDAGRRGTGLEYLENVLPPSLQRKLLPFFKHRTIAQYARRSDEMILGEIASEKDDVAGALERLLEKTRARHGLPVHSEL